MPGLLDGVRSFYFSMEDKYYSVLDKLQKKISVYSVIDPIDKIVPSFVLVLAIALLLIVGLIVGITGGLAGTTTSGVALTVTFTNADNSPVSGVEVTLNSLGDTPSSFDKITDSSGQAEFTIPPGDYSVSASADGFDDFSQDITVTSDKQLQFQLSPTAPLVKSRSLVILDQDGAVLGSLSPVTISLSFACQSGTPPASQTVFKGNITVLQPASCIGLSATISVNGFVTKSQPILGDTTTIQLQSAEEQVIIDTPTQGSIEVTVRDQTLAPVSGVQFKLYKVSLGGSDVLAAQSLSDSGGFAALSDVAPGKYTLTATKQGYKIYTSSEFQVNAGEKSTIIATIEKSSTSKSFLVKILSSEDQQPVSSATIVLFVLASGGKYIEEGTYTTDSNGVVNQPVGDFDSPVQAVVSHSSFVTEIVSNQGIVLADETTPIPILIDPVEAKGANGNIPNALIADVKVVDLLGFPVINANTILFTPDLNGIFVGQKKTNASGIARYENLPAGTYQARASTSSTDGNSAKVTGNVNATIILTATLDNGTALVEVTVKDSFNKPLADVNVSTYQYSNNTLLAQASTNANGVATLGVKSVDLAYIKTTKSGYVPFTSVPFGVIKDNVHKINAEMSLTSATPSLDVELISIYELSTSGTKTLAASIVPGATYEFHFSVKAPVSQSNIKALVRVNGKVPAEYQVTDPASLTGGKSAIGGLLFFTQTNGADEFLPPVSSATSSSGPAKVMLSAIGNSTGANAYEVIANVTINANAFPGTDKLELAYQTKSDSTLSALHVESYTIGNPLPPQGDFGFLFFISQTGSTQKTQVSSALPVKIEANKEYTLEYLVTNASGTNFPTATMAFVYPSGTVIPSSVTLPGFNTSQSVSGSVKLKATVPCTSCSSLTATLANVGTGKSPTSYTLNVQVTPEKEITLKATPTFLVPGLTQTVAVVALDNDGNPLNVTHNVQVTGKLKKKDTVVSFTGSPQGVFIASIHKDDALEGELVEVTGVAPGYLSDTLSVPISTSGIGNFSQDFSCVTFTPTGPFFTPPSNGSITVKTTNCLESLKLYTTGDGPISLSVKSGSTSINSPSSALSLAANDTKTLALSSSSSLYGLFPVYVYAKYDSQPAGTFVKINAIDVQVNPQDGSSHCLNIDGYVVDLTDGSDSAEVTNACNPLVKDAFLPSASLDLDGAFAHALPSVATPEMQSGASVPFEWQVNVDYDFSNTDNVSLDDVSNAFALGDENWYRYSLPDAADIVVDPALYVNAPVLIPDTKLITVGGSPKTFLEYKDLTAFPFYGKGKKSIMYETTLIVPTLTVVKSFCAMGNGMEKLSVSLDGVQIHGGAIQSVGAGDTTNCSDMDAAAKNVTLAPGPHVLRVFMWDKDADKEYETWFGLKIGNATTWDQLKEFFSLNPQYGSPFLPPAGFSGTLSYPPASPKSDTFSLSNKGVPVKIGTLADSADNPIRSILTNAKGTEQLKSARIQSYSSNPSIRVFVKDFDVYAQYVGFDDPSLKQNIVFENTGLASTRYAVLTLSDYVAKDTDSKDLYAGILLDSSSSVLLNMENLPNASSTTPTQNGLCSFLQNMEGGLKYYSNPNVHFKLFVLNQPASFTGVPCGGTIIPVTPFPGFDSTTQSSAEFWAEGAKAVAGDSFWGGLNNANKLLVVITDTKATGTSGLPTQYADAIETLAVSDAGNALANAGIRAAVLYKTPMETTAVVPGTTLNKAIASYVVFSSNSLGSGFAASDGLVEALDYSEFIPTSSSSGASLIPFEHAQNNKVVQRLAQFAFGVKEENIVLKVIAPPLNACIGENGETGVTGTVNRPKILLNWGWNESSGVAMSLCDAKTGLDAGSFAYCDGTQFTISLVKKLELLRQALSANATPAQVAQIPFLTSFDAYLIRDAYTNDFRSDFVTLNTSTSFADAPPYFLGSSGGDGAWKDYINPGTALQFRMNTDPVGNPVPFVLPSSGLYRVQINYTSPTFFAAGSPSSTITVTFTQLANAKSLSNYSELYEIPFDGLVGLEQTGSGAGATYQLARQGYGAGFTGDTGVVISTETKFVPLKTYASKPGSTPFVPLAVSRETDFVKLNTGSLRGVGVEYNTTAGTLTFHSAVPTPVVAEWSTNSSGKGEFFYGINENIIPNPGTYISYTTSAGPLAKWVPVASQNTLQAADCELCNVCLDAGNNAFELSTLADHNPSAMECTGFNSQLNATNTFGFSSQGGTANTTYLSTVFYSNPENGAEYKMVSACNPASTGIPAGKFATPIAIGSQSNAAVLAMDTDDLLTYQSTLSLNELLNLISNPSNETAEGWTCVSSQNNAARVYWNAPRLRQHVFDKWAGNNFGVLSDSLACKATGTPLFSGDFWTLTEQSQTISQPNDQITAAKLCPLYNAIPSAGQYNQFGIPYPVGTTVYIPGDDIPLTNDPLNPAVQYRFDPSGCVKSGNASCGTNANKFCPNNVVRVWQN